MHEELTSDELQLTLAALDCYIGEYNHKEQYLADLDAVCDKIIRMRLALDGINIISRIGGA